MDGTARCGTVLVAWGAVISFSGKLKTGKLDSCECAQDTVPGFSLPEFRSQVYHLAGYFYLSGFVASSAKQR